MTVRCVDDFGHIPFVKNNFMAVRISSAVKKNVYFERPGRGTKLTRIVKYSTWYRVLVILFPSSISPCSSTVRRWPGKPSRPPATLGEPVGAFLVESALRCFCCSRRRTRLAPTRQRRSCSVEAPWLAWQGARDGKQMAGLRRWKESEVLPSQREPQESFHIFRMDLRIGLDPGE